MGAQLALPLVARRAVSRERPAIDRLRDVLTRQGFDWRWRALTGSVLIRPSLVTRFGYQPMCGRYCCGNLTFERVDYCERPPLTGEERVAHAVWREQVWRAEIHEMWGAP